MNGQLDVLKWWQTEYLSDEPDVHELLVRAAVLHGHLRILEWLLEGDENLQIIHDMEPALYFQHRHIADWIHSRNPRILLKVAYNDAAKRGDLEFIRWMEHQPEDSYIIGSRLRLGCIMDAVIGGHMEVLQWAHERDPLIFHNIEMDLAAENGHLHVLQWLACVKRQYGHRLTSQARKQLPTGILISSSG